MTTAYWCILIAAVLPYAWVTIAKASGGSAVTRTCTTTSKGACPSNGKW